MKNTKKTMKTSKTTTGSLNKEESSQPNNRDHQSPRQGTEQTPRGPSPYMTKANFEALRAASQFRAVYVDGPIAHKPTEEAEEVPTWIVFIGTAEREPVSKTYQCNSLARARGLAGVMARDRGIELIDEATTA